MFNFVSAVEHESVSPQAAASCFFSTTPIGCAIVLSLLAAAAFYLAARLMRSRNPAALDPAAHPPKILG